jgi:hypothetical protein
MLTPQEKTIQEFNRIFENDPTTILKSRALGINRNTTTTTAASA